MASRQLPSAMNAPSAPVEIPVNQDHINELVNMGIDRSKAEQALRATGNNLHAALEWIFSKNS